ncbi:MAG: hypothetical protein ABII19_01710 [Patescibacteria group bacterium]
MVPLFLFHLTFATLYIRCIQACHKWTAIEKEEKMVTIEIGNTGVEERKRRFKEMLAREIVKIGGIGDNVDVTIRFCGATDRRRGPLNLRVLAGNGLPDHLHGKVADGLCAVARRFYEENGHSVRPVETTIGSVSRKID